MSRKIHGENDSERITREGTAARTRPLSIKDIMLRREKKAASESKKSKEGLENGKGKSTHLEQGREHKSRKDPKDMPVEGSRKEKSRDATREGFKKENPRDIPRENPKKEDMRYAPKEVSKKDNSRDRPNTGAKMDDQKDAPKVLEKEGLRDAPKKASKKQRPSGDDNHSVREDKGIYHSQKLGTNMSGRADESKDRNFSEIRERKGDVMRFGYQKEPGKRWNDEAFDDKIKFKSEKLWNETKRKDRTFDNERNSEVGRPMLKKQDSARFQDSRHSDRNAGRNEYAKPYHVEPGSKRRRSRSRDHDRERYGRSISPPPREERYNYRGRDFGNYPPYYSTEKSRRKYAEVDKQRSSGSGGYIGGSQKHESRLGGYSPRKKKTSLQAEQATTKTPSKAIQSPEKKSATWDQPPVKANQSNFPTTFLPTVGQMAPTPFTVSAIKDPSTTVEPMLAGSSLTADSVQLTQATRPLRRLHIENLPDLATEDKLIDCLNDFLLPTGIKTQRSKPCLSCTVSKLEFHLLFPPYHVFLINMY